MTEQTREPRQKLPSSQAAWHEHLYMAAMHCPHEIDSTRVVLHYDEKQPGENALAQLAERLGKALSGVAGEQAAGLTDKVTREQIEAWARRAGIVGSGADGALTEPNLVRLGDFAIAAREPLLSRAAPSGEPVAWKWRRHKVDNWQSEGHWDASAAGYAADLESKGFEVVRLYAAPQPSAQQADPLYAIGNYEMQQPEQPAEEVREIVESLRGMARCTSVWEAEILEKAAALLAAPAAGTSPANPMHPCSQAIAQLERERRVDPAKLNMPLDAALLAPQAAETGQERKYTQADMERYGKAVADAREARIKAATGAQGLTGSGEDTKRLDALAQEYWDLRSFEIRTWGDDSDVGWRVIEHHMAEPRERVVAEVFKDDPRAAIDAALAASRKEEA